MANEIYYNKLVRDKIPEIITANSKKANYHIANEDELKSRLINKVKEELEEFKQTPNEEEIADLLEVIDHLIVAFNLNPNKIDELKKTKHEERGGFKKGIILDSVIE